MVGTNRHSRWGLLDVADLSCLSMKRSSHDGGMECGMRRHPGMSRGLRRKVESALKSGKEPIRRMRARLMRAKPSLELPPEWDKPVVKVERAGRRPRAPRGLIRASWP